MSQTYNSYFKEYYAKNKDKINAKRKGKAYQQEKERHRRKNEEGTLLPIIIRNLLRSSKVRANQKNLENTLVATDIVIPEVCPVFGTIIDLVNANGIDSPSIDRIDNDKGYTPENIKIISIRANRLKNQNTKETLLQILKYMEKSQT